MSRVPRPTYHHGNLRAAALERAAQLAADGGTGALSLRQLARDLGVSPAALYRHFADKDALLDGLAQRALAALESAARDALARAGGDQADAAESLAALGSGYLAFASSHPDAFRIVFELRPKAGRDPVEAAPYLLLLEAVTALAPPGADAARVRRAALAAWAFVHGLATLGAQQAWVAGEVAAAAEGLLRDYARGLRVGFPS
ncbi:MAG: TetR/AcrR family transcriptional regulator [Pseudomonadota bacterium]